MTSNMNMNTVEIKNQYTKLLTNTLSPLLYEGIKQLYNKAQDDDKMAQQTNTKEKFGVLKIFQVYLRDIKNLNNQAIDQEYQRLKDKSKISASFDKLIKVVVTSHLYLFTFNNVDTSLENFVGNYDIPKFLHNCYIECARYFFNYPELFWENFDVLQKKNNKKEVLEIIKTSIEDTLVKSLPLDEMLVKYLDKTYEMIHTKSKQNLDNSSNTGILESDYSQHEPEEYDKTESDSDTQSNNSNPDVSLLQENNGGYQEDTDDSDEVNENSINDEDEEEDKTTDELLLDVDNQINLLENNKPDNVPSNLNPDNSINQVNSILGGNKKKSPFLEMLANENSFAKPNNKNLQEINKDNKIKIETSASGIFQGSKVKKLSKHLVTPFNK